MDVNGSQVFFLLIETSTEICSIAIADESGIIHIEESTIENSHSELITILIQDCINKSCITLNNLSAIAISNGPGSYTSLRVGAATAKGLCYALNIPLIAISSLRSLAQGVKTSNTNILIIPMIDARRMEVYAQIYDHDLVQIESEKAIILDENVFHQERSNYRELHVCGSGAQKYYDNFATNHNIFLHHTTASASYLFAPTLEKWKNKQFEDIAYYEPNYLKPPNITTSLKSKL